ncbi:MAG: SH3 domain-containing C40 family peptidase [Lachnospiraceae bacterium]
MKHMKTLAVGCVLATVLQTSLSVDAATIASMSLSANVGFASVITEEIDEQSCIDYVVSGENTLWGYTNLGLANVEGSLNIRETADTSGKVLGKMVNGTACEILDEVDGWYYIESGEITGYVSSEYIISGIEAKVMASTMAYNRAVIVANSVNVRMEPTTDSAVVDQVAMGQEFELVEVLEEGWAKVILNTDEVYINLDFVEVVDGLTTAMTITELTYGVGISDLRIELCEYAQQFVGNPYVWGGTSLTKGADCSGFVLSVFKNYGISLSHSSAAQSNEGTVISVSEVEPGDLLFYGTSASNISHVAIYIGNGQIVHASTSTTGIIIGNSNYRTPVKAVRVLPE